MEHRTVFGKVVLITGGTGGIGKETALGLAKLGATVVIVGRDEVRGDAAVRELRERSGNPNVSLLQADLSSQASIRKLAEAFKVGRSRLDVLVNNVGGLSPERWETGDGVEATFAVNVLAPFLLTHLLLNMLRGSAPARVVNLTGGMPGSHLHTEDLLAERSFLGLLTYTRAKAAMSAVSLELSRRLAGAGVSVNVVYPGGASTAMTGAMTPAMLPSAFRPFWPIFKTMQKPDGGESAAKAARSSLFAASSPQLEGKTGLYIGADSRPTAWPKAFLDERARGRVWRLCERLTGLTDAPTSSLAETPANLRTPGAYAQVKGAPRGSHES